MTLSYFASEVSSQIHSYDTPWFMYAAIVVALLVYAAIEAHHTKNDHIIGIREAVKWSVVYISIALLFAIPVYLFISPQASGEYLAAWSIEKALSLDNIFIFGLIFASFNVDQRLQRRMLNYGIAGAIVFRLIFILGGLALLKRFEWVSIVFGLILAKASWNAFKQARRKKEDKSEDDITKKPLWRIINRLLPIYPQFVGHQLTVKINGKRMLTMMAAIIILIELTDIIFAVDSVPAVLAVSPDKFIAYSSNVFALLGLRALYFVYDSVAEKFWAISWALCGMLAWISIKLIGAPFGLHIPVSLSLGVLGVLFVGGIMISLLVTKKPKNTNIHA